MTMQEIINALTRAIDRASRIREDIHWANSDELPYLHEELRATNAEIADLQKRRDALANN